jgi:uncharacterized membrane protein
MKKKGNEKFEHQNHPIYQMHSRRTLGQKAADVLTRVAGSLIFILSLFAFLLVWMIINSYIFLKYAKGEPFDPYPFILLNLVLSCLAAIQAPIILMSQNRLAQRDRIKAEYDYRINKKAEEEIREIKELLLKKRK